MSEDHAFSVSQLRAGGQRMHASAEDLVSKTEALLGEVGDVSALGTNDTLGSVASMLYELALDAVRESITSIKDEYGEHGDKLTNAAEQFGTAEEGYAQVGTQLSQMRLN